jgi:hypothetical protein
VGDQQYQIDYKNYAVIAKLSLNKIPEKRYFAVPVKLYHIAVTFSQCSKNAKTLFSSQLVPFARKVSGFKCFKEKHFESAITASFSVLFTTIKYVFNILRSSGTLRF